MEEELILFIQIEEETNKVVGYSSSKMHDTDIEVKESELEENFLAIPIFYKYDKETGKFVYSEECKQEVMNKKEESLSDIEKLAQNQSQTELELMLLKQQLHAMLINQGGTK